MQNYRRCFSYDAASWRLADEDGGQERAEEQLEQVGDGVGVAWALPHAAELQVEEYTEEAFQGG